MVLENVCAPALLYLAFSIIQIIIDMYRGDTIQAFFKFIVMIIFTIVLNAICSSGMTIISWFIVFIPFILMTYVTTILFFIFGINPSKMKPSDKKCWETQFGCCGDGITTKEDPSGRSCPQMRLVNVLSVSEPTAANNKDSYYLYPQGRSSRDYSIGGGSVRTNKGTWRDNNKDSNYYDAKRSEKYRDMLRSKISPKAMDSKELYWRSKLNKSDWNDDKEIQDKIANVSTPAAPDSQDKSMLSFLLPLLLAMSPQAGAAAGAQAGGAAGAPVGGAAGGGAAGGGAAGAPVGGAAGGGAAGAPVGGAAQQNYPTGTFADLARIAREQAAQASTQSAAQAAQAAAQQNYPTGTFADLARISRESNQAQASFSNMLGSLQTAAQAPVQTSSSVPPAPVQTNSSVPPAPVSATR